jgi:hypothetical protein
VIRALCIAVAIASCGGPQQPPPTGEGSGLGSAEPVAKDTRTPFEIRRDTACKQLAPRLTECAVDDAKADLAAGKVTQQQFQQDTAPEVLHKNTQQFVEKCTGWRDMSSRQVRVLEVCFKSETECGALKDCLKNLEAKP